MTRDIIDTIPPRYERLLLVRTEAGAKALAVTEKGTTNVASFGLFTVRMICISRVTHLGLLYISEMAYHSSS